MATIALTIAGRGYELACRNGEEAHLRRIAAIVDAKASDAVRTMGGMSEARQMLFAALLLADEVDEARSALTLQEAPRSASAVEQTAVVIERLAERLERLAALIDQPVSAVGFDRLETPVADA